jgi:hypothetical protein
VAARAGDEHVARGDRVACGERRRVAGGADRDQLAIDGMNDRDGISRQEPAAQATGIPGGKGERGVEDPGDTAAGSSTGTVHLPSK